MQHAAARTTRSMAAQRCSEAVGDNDEEQDHVVEAMTTPTSQPSGAMHSHGAEGGAGAITGNVNLATSPTQATTVRASQGHGGDGSVRVGNKRKLTSIVWEGNFEKKIINGEPKADCMYCHKLFIAKGTNGTSHLLSHMSSCGARDAPIGPKQQKIRLSKVYEGKGNLEKIVFDQDVARKELALMICVGADHVLLVEEA
nr:uncharacterized protein LOC120976428 [Aegilops tauschii subsp. strangulata]